MYGLLTNTHTYTHTHPNTHTHRNTHAARPYDVRFTQFSELSLNPQQAAFAILFYVGTFIFNKYSRFSIERCARESGRVGVMVSYLELENKVRYCRQSYSSTCTTGRVI